MPTDVADDLDLQALWPRDEFNLQLQSNVRPPDWKNPTPQGRYNLVVIGGGTAGLVTAAGAAGLGARVALVERALMGGDCLNVGCVPSKAVIAAARRAAAVRDASAFGIRLPAPAEVEFAQVMRRMRRLRASISPHDSAKRFTELGVDVYLGHARFAAQGVVEVAGTQLRFKRAVIATGARAATLPVPGLAESGCLTNETVFSLTELPRRMAVIGSGPIGCELAQSFARLGSTVTLIDISPRILPREDADASQILHQAMQRDGVEILLQSTLQQVSTDGGRLLTVSTPQGTRRVEVDQILLAVGRSPNVDGLNLDVVGVRFDARHGVQVNDRLQTTNRRIFAAGDVCSEFKFTHAADFLARTVIRNALFMGRARASALRIPWSTYTSPEIAHVGWSESQAAERGTPIDTVVQRFDSIDRAILDGETAGMVKVHLKKGTDQIVGATIVAPHAGDLICQLTLAMNNRIGLKAIANSIHPYPTLADAIRKLGDTYNRGRLTPRVRRIFKAWLSWSR